MSRAAAILAFKCMDLPSLGDNDTEEAVLALAAKATAAIKSTDTEAGETINVAALCVWPKFVPAVKKYLKDNSLHGKVKVATVVNFPGGQKFGANAGPDGASVTEVVEATKAAVAGGADEIDLVLPYKGLVAAAGNLKGADAVVDCLKMVTEVKKACGVAKLKVILETADLEKFQNEKPDSPPLPLVTAASNIALLGGADYIKTSTGKSKAGGASLGAARAMLEAIRAGGHDCGLKISGGVRTAADAEKYLDLAHQYCGALGKPGSTTFRFGASGLGDSLKEVINGEPDQKKRKVDSSY